ncbi:MAG: hypothetical protein ABF519_07225 [Leuconostoc mesenteroides]
MEQFNLYLSIGASLLAIISTVWGALNQKEIKRINKLLISNNTMTATGDNNNQQYGNNNKVNDK